MKTMRLYFWLVVLDITGWLDLLTTRLYLWTVGKAGAAVDYPDEVRAEPGEDPF